jgi:hypothetical protein
MDKGYRIRVDLTALNKADMSVEKALQLFEETGILLDGLYYEGHPLEFILNEQERTFQESIKRRVSLFIVLEIDFMQKNGDWRFPKEYLNWKNNCNAGEEMQEFYIKMGNVMRCPVMSETRSHLVRENFKYNF